MPTVYGSAKATMNLLATIRSRHLPLARTLVALLAVGWLGLALQPCHAMGADHPGSGSHGAPHGDHAGHGGHVGHDSTSDGCDTPCPHCPSNGPDHCNVGVALDCEAVGVPVLPAKKAESPSLDAIAWHAAPVLAATGPAPFLLSPLAPDPGRVRTPSSSLQQRYCTYLK